MNNQDTLDSERPSSPAGAIALFFCGLILLIGFLSSLIANWNAFVQQSSQVVRFTLIVAGVTICLSIMFIAVYKGYMTWLHLQHLREDLAFKRDERKRTQERHELQQYLAESRLFPDPLGNRPYVYSRATGQVIEVSSGNYLAPVPHTYSPRIEWKPTTTLADITGASAENRADGLVLPSIEQFYSIIPYNSLQVGLGIELDTGKPITAEILRSTHFKFIGGSDTGKSCLAAATLDIATTTNDPDRLQIGLLDMEYKTSRLFEDLPHVAEIGPKRIRLVGRNPEEVAQKIGWLKWEMVRRAKLPEIDLQKEPVLLVYVEEMLALKYEVEDKKLKEQMLADINILGVRCRKYRIYLLAVMQIDYSDKSTREAMAMFRTRGGFALEPNAARASGFHSSELVKTNYAESRQGQYVLEKPAYNGLVLAPEYDVKARLAQVGVATTRATTNDPMSHYRQAEYTAPEVESDLAEEGMVVTNHLLTTTASQADTRPLTEQERRIIRKFKNEGMNVSQIVASEFTDTKGQPLKGGKMFTQRCQEIYALLQRFIPADV